MSIRQAALNRGLNPWGLDLIVESLAFGGHFELVGGMHVEHLEGAATNRSHSASAWLQLKCAFDLVPYCQRAPKGIYWPHRGGLFRFYMEH